MSNVNKNIAVEAKLISPPTYLIQWHISPLFQINGTLHLCFQKSVLGLRIHCH